jgi:hypothetical protein
MKSAADIPARGLFGADYGPLYGLWYYGLSLVQPDRLQLYPFAWSVLAFLVSAGLYVLGRALGGTRVVCLVAAFLTLTSSLPDVYPHPTHLASVLLMLGTAWAVQTRCFLRAGFVLSFTLLLTGYIRPEYYVSFLVSWAALAGGAGWAVLRQPGTWRARAAAPLLLAGIALSLRWWLGDPLGGNRSFSAFAQHYAVGAARDRQLPINAWTYPGGVVREDFGEAASVWQAVRNNPGAVLRHGWRNVQALPEALSSAAVPDLDCSAQCSLVLRWVLVAVAALAVVGMVRSWRSPGLSPEGDHAVGIALRMVAFLLIPTTASVLLIAPRLHYLVPIVLFTFALLAPFCHRFRGVPAGASSRGWLNAGRVVLPVAALLLAATPNRSHGWDLQRWVCPSKPPPAAASTLRRTVLALRGLKITRPFTILGSGGGSVGFYSALPHQAVPPAEKVEGFWPFVEHRDIGVIILDRGLSGDDLFREDAAFQEFAASGRPGAFTLFAVPASDVRIAVRNDLLP